MQSTPIRARVITVSDRCSAGLREDLSGPQAAAALSEWAVVDGVVVIPDGEASVRSALERALADGVNVVITTGGTGISPRDRTPEGTLPLLTQRLEGIENLIRYNPEMPHAAISRGYVGVIEAGGQRALVANAPGSRGGVKDTVAVLGPMLTHLVDQLGGGDHPDGHTGATWAAQHSGLGKDHTGEHAKVVIASISDEPIDMDALEAAVRDDRAGASLSFCGTVRNHDGDHTVESIEYVGHPDSQEVLEKIAEEVARDCGAYAIAVQHRVGHVPLGGVALGAVVSGAHRQETFATLTTLIEEIKMRLPIWKKQLFPDGGHEWSGSA